MISIVLLLITALAGISNAPQSAQSRPVYEVHRTGKPVAIDGKLDDAAWAGASVAGFSRNLDGSPSRLGTEARMLYDDQFLYFSFRCPDDNIWSTMKQRDEHLWTEEVVEVFLQADSTQKSYIELEVNPLGTMLDIFLLDVRKPIPYRSWNSDRLKWAVQVDGSVDGQAGDKEWSCEIALPMQDIVPTSHTPAKPGDRWRLNLYRVENKPARESSAWSPTLRNDFHIPAMFGEIVFTDKIVQ